MKINRLLSIACPLLLFLLLVSCGGGGGGGNTPQANNQTFSISGTVSGLAAGQQVTLINNGADAQTISSNSSFKFPTPVANNGSYSVAVSAQPSNQVCTVNQGAGAGVIADINNVNIVCSTDSYSISGSVTGLAPGTQLTVADNNADPLIITTNGVFHFTTPIALNGSYSVIVENQASGQTCTVSQGSGSGVEVDISNVIVNCSVETYAVTVTVTGLSSGQQLTALNNGSDAQIVTSNGAFTFPTPIASNGSYLVTIGTQPTGENCVLTNGSGPAATDPIHPIGISCSKVTYTIGGTVTGLAQGAQVTLTETFNNSGSIPLTVTTNGAFTFSNLLGYNYNYAVTVGTQPVGQNCAVVQGAGSGLSGNINNINVSCSNNSNAGTITGCVEITTGGNYTIAAGITAAPNYSSNNSNACIYIHDTSNVNLDCAKNSVIGSPPIALNNVHGFSITNCAFQTTGTLNLDITNSDTGTFNNNSYSGITTGPTFAYVNVVSTSNLIFDSNTISGNYAQYSSNNNTISNNHITAVSANTISAAGIVISATGVNTKIIGNTLDGSWDHSYRTGLTFPNQYGADDGIDLEDEIGALVQNNAIKNVWDCGIELSGALSNSTISGNQISFAALTGIGGFYYLDVIGSTFSNNTITEAGNAFTFFRLLGLKTPATPALQQLGIGTSVIFSNNLFSGNSFTTTGILPPVLTGESASFSLYDYLDYSFQYSPGSNGEIAPLPSQFLITNNTFTNNNFGHTYLAPQMGVTTFTTTGVVIDGGGNICSIPSYEVNYPLACN